MIGDGYWSTGIVLKYSGDGKWSASLDFYDDGFCDDESTEGNLHTRYFVGIETAIDTLIADAKTLGIRFVNPTGDNPRLYAYGDGESKEWPMPKGYDELLSQQARRIGYDYGFANQPTEQPAGNNYQE